jgi:hypothetical protein
MWAYQAVRSPHLSCPISFRAMSRAFRQEVLASKKSMENLKALGGDKPVPLGGQLSGCRVLDRTAQMQMAQNFDLGCIRDKTLLR